MQTVDQPLYKYRGFRSDKQRERVRDILINHRLYVASPRSMNDPFECRVQYSFEASEQLKLEVATVRIQKENPHFSEQQAIALAPDRCRLLEKHAAGNLESMVDGVGLISFGGNKDNLLMWAHYADEHAGLCIEFRCTDGRHTEFFGPAEQVRYQEELPSINPYTDNAEKRVKVQYQTKSSHWVYEDEWRILVLDRKAKPFFSFPPDIISAIYLGCRTTDKDMLDIQSWIAERGTPMKIYKAKQSDTKYGFDFFAVS